METLSCRRGRTTDVSSWTVGTALLILIAPLSLLLGPACTAPVEKPADEEASRDEIRPPEFLGEATIPTGTLYDGHQVGGLSGIARVGKSEYVAVSDDRVRFGPLRTYRLRIDLGDGRLDEGDVEIVGWTRLRRGEDSPATNGPLAERVIDLEGIVAAPDGTFLISTEGDTEAGIAPCIARFDSSGELLEVIEPPDKLVPRPDEGWGVRFNLGLESLTLSPDGRILYTATENAVVQDGPAADFDQSSPARLLLYDLTRDEWASEHLYAVAPVHTRPPDADPDAYRGAGLTELLALESGDLLALERSFVDGAGMGVKLFRINLEGADDVSDRDALADAALDELTPISKTLLLDLTQFPELDNPLDNLEAIAFAPPLADGRCPLLIVSDNNFNPEGQVTQILAFALDGVECPPPTPN